MISKLVNNLLEEEERDREEALLAKRERELHSEKVNIVFKGTRASL